MEDVLGRSPDPNPSLWAFLRVPWAFLRVPWAFLSSGASPEGFGASLKAPGPVWWGHGQIPGSGAQIWKNPENSKNVWGLPLSPPAPLVGPLGPQRTQKSPPGGMGPLGPHGAHVGPLGPYCLLGPVLLWASLCLGHYLHC